jgi:UDP-N-acetylglucosamine 1-carboxyvinyltransferase
VDSIWIRGGAALKGEIPISGAKNAALALMPSALLTEEKLTLRNLPRLADVDTFAHLLNQLGVSTSVAGVKKGEIGRRMTLQADEIVSTVAPYDMVRKMRASVLVLGPMLARMGEATVSLPGGCAIGDRPIDLHLKALECMGAEIELTAGYVKASAPKGRLPGGDFSFPVVSVGATENAVMAAVLATGKTQLFNAAREPEIVDLCNLLSSMGAQLSGVGSSTLEIEGVDGLHACPEVHQTVPDRIVAGTFAVGAVMTRGDVLVRGGRVEHLEILLDKLVNAGASVDVGQDGFRVTCESRPRAVDVVTLPYPGFPTDLQPAMIALASVSEGVAMVTETVFEARFVFCDELTRLGADVRTDGHHAVIRGRTKLSGAPVRAPDIRAGAALVLAGLVADGVTEVTDIRHIDRGYVRFDEQLRQLGARISRAPAPDDPDS